MGLVELIYTTRLGETKPTFVVIDEISDRGEIKIILPNGRIVFEKSILLAPPLEGDETNATMAQIEALAQFEKREELRVAEEAKKIFERQESARDLVSFLDNFVRAKSVNLKALAGYAKKIVF